MFSSLIRSYSQKRHPYLGISIEYLSKGLRGIKGLVYKRFFIDLVRVNCNFRRFLMWLL